LTADVTVDANANEIRDYKYVDKAELQAMFENEGMATDIFVLCASDDEIVKATRSPHGSSLSRVTSSSAGGTNYFPVRGMGLWMRKA
jgi:hypothetical protein